MNGVRLRNRVMSSSRTFQKKSEEKNTPDLKSRLRGGEIMNAPFCGKRPKHTNGKR